MEQIAPDAASVLFELSEAEELARLGALNRAFADMGAQRGAQLAWRRLLQSRFGADPGPPDADCKRRFRELRSARVATMFSWGAGDGSKAIPTLGGRGVVQVASGTHHSVALLASGEVRCWGDNYRGQLGDPDRARSRLPRPPSVRIRVAQLSCGPQHTLAVCRDGSAWAWGDNSELALGLPRDVRVAGEPRRVMAAHAPVPLVKAVCGRHCSALIDAEGALFVCGLNLGNRLALRSRNVGGVGRSDIFQQFHQGAFVRADLDEPVSDVAFGLHHALVVTREGGGLLAWGQNSEGQLGVATAACASTLAPIRVPLPHAVAVEAVVAEKSFSAVRDADGRLWLSDGAEGLRAVDLPERCGAMAADTDCVWVAGADSGRLFCCAPGDPCWRAVRQGAGLGVVGLACAPGAPLLVLHR